VSMFSKKTPEKEVVLKDILGELEKSTNVQDMVLRVINKASGMSPFDPFSQNDYSGSASISQSVSISSSVSPSAEFDYSELRR